MRRIRKMTEQERMQWFRDAKLGLFIHWGPYSLLGRCEWAFRLDGYKVKEYEKVAEGFTGDGFDADQWCAMAVKAGMKYIVLTARHHDGYCLFDSKVSHNTSVKGTPKRDFIREYTDAARRAGLKVGLYYSLVDWRYKGAWDHDRYPESVAAMVQQAHEQVRELMTDYGRIDLLWYDGAQVTTWEWKEHEDIAEFWRARELNAMVRGLQPHIVINNRSGTVEDYVTPERKIEASKEGLPWESCLSICPLSWSYVPDSPNRKTAAAIIRDLIEIAAGGGNLLLNTGPKPDGSMNETEIGSILEAGDWVKRNAEMVYHARRSPLNEFGPHGPNGCLGRWIGSDDPRVHYLAAIGWSGREFWSVRIEGKVESVTIVGSGESVAYRQEGFGRLILQDLPDMPSEPHFTVFKVTFAEPPKAQPEYSRAEWIESDL
ncbi:alpha-L-fucosidase [Paenibacillus sp. H1-7]|nr:alpha-L-fucosidase [Paenibacillus sp. H1-7]